MDSINSIGYVKTTHNSRVSGNEKQGTLDIQEPKEDKSSAVIATLTALSAAAIAVLSIRKGKKSKIINEVIDQGKKSIDEIVDGAAAEIKKAPKKYKIVKQQAIRNHTHAEKKYIKKQLRVVQDSNLVVEATRQKALSKAVKKTEQAAEIANHSQQIRNAKSQEQLQKIVHSAEQKSALAKENAEKAKEVSETIATKRAKRTARVAENRATQAELQARKTQEKALQQQEFLRQEEIRKAPAREITANRTPEQLEKQKINAEKAQANAVHRNAKKDAVKPQNARPTAVSIAEQRLIPSLVKKYPNTQEGNQLLIDMLGHKEAPYRNAAKAILEFRGIS